jgi:hypothetical protein
MPAIKAGKLQKGEWTEKAQELANEVVDQLTIDWGGLVETIACQIKEVYATAAVFARTAFGALVAWGRSFFPNQNTTDQVNDSAVAYARDRAAEMVGEKVVDGKLVPNPNAKWAITDSTRDALNSLIVDALIECKSIDELAGEIEALADEEGTTPFSAKRARTIARTELGLAYAHGYREGARAAGATMHASVLSGAHCFPDECDEAAKDGDIPIDQPFSNGKMGPLYHPNCKCTEVFSCPDSLPVCE